MRMQVCVLVAMGPGANLAKIAADIVTDVRESHVAVRPALSCAMYHVNVRYQSASSVAERRNKVTNANRAGAATQSATHHQLLR